MDDLAIAHIERARNVGESVVGRGDRTFLTELRERRLEPGTEAGAREEAGPAAGQESDEARLARLEHLAERLNRFFSTGKGIRFQVSGQEDQIVVQVVDQETDEVIRSIPSDRLMRVREDLGDLGSGVLLDNEV